MDEDNYSTWNGLQWSPPEFVRAPGGPPSNVAIALVRLGGRVVFMGKVVDNPTGYQMVLKMNNEHVQTRGVKFYPYASTTVSYMKARMFHFNSMVLLEQSTHATLLAAIKMSKEFGGVIFFDVNLPLPLWRSRDERRKLIKSAWNEANVIEVTMQELEFLVYKDYFEQKRNYRPQYYTHSYEQSVGEGKRRRRRRCYHYTREEIASLWHDNIKILFVTDGTFRIHYYTPTFEGAVIGTEDVLVMPFTCDRTGSGIIRKLTSQPELYDDQVLLEKQLRFAICAGIIAQWTIGAVQVFPTKSVTQNLKEQVYVPSLW
eukprot:PITA_02894